MTGRDRGAHGYPSHRFHATGNRDVILPRHDSGCSEVDGLLARSTLAVHGRRGDGLGPAGCEHRISPQVPALVPDLAHTSSHDVVDDVNGNSCPLHQGLQDQRGYVHRMNLGEATF